MNRHELDKYGLAEQLDLIRSFALTAIGFELIEANTESDASHLGGRAFVPRDFSWPMHDRRKLDHLLQINLAELRDFSDARVLPRDGLLSFFYDLQEQPWGFDPRHITGARVMHFTGENIEPVTNPNPIGEFRRLDLRFFGIDTLPQIGSRAFEHLSAVLPAEIQDAYFDFSDEYEARQYPELGGRHRLFGHSSNVQGDMQLEAQLVTNGLYCGDSSGYDDPRARALESGADEWQLLLQLDSDERADFMWGDAGMLYWHMRRQDLAEHKFSNAWMTLQCG